MDISESMTLEECRHTIARMVERDPDIRSIRRSLHVSRLKLGAAIERIESGPLPTAPQQIQDHAESVAFEIDALVEAFRCKSPEQVVHRKQLPVGTVCQ